MFFFNFHAYYNNHRFKTDKFIYIWTNGFFSSFKAKSDIETDNCLLMYQIIKMSKW